MLKVATLPTQVMPAFPTGWQERLFLSQEKAAHPPAEVFSPIHQRLRIIVTIFPSDLQMSEEQQTDVQTLIEFGKKPPLFPLCISESLSGGGGGVEIDPRWSISGLQKDLENPNPRGLRLFEHLPHYQFKPNFFIY